MKLKNLTTVFFLLFFVANVTAQSMDIIFLKDGTRIKGIIENFVPNEFLEVSVDGNLLRYEASEIRRVVNNRGATGRGNAGQGRIINNGSTIGGALDIVFLKDGTRIRGVIENFVPNEFLEIRVKDEVVRYDASEIKRIVNNRSSTGRGNAGVEYFQTGGETIDEVHLINGEVIQGKIIDLKRGEFVEIEVDGIKKRYEQDEIRRIKSEVPVPTKVIAKEKQPKEIIDPATLKTKGIYNATYISFAYGNNVEGEFNMGPGVHAVLGKQWSDYQGLGLGIGIDNYRASRGETVYPIYVDYRMYPIKKNKMYYLNLNAGYGFAFKSKSRGITEADGGLYGASAIGFRSATKDGVSMNMELGYKYQYAYFEEMSDRTGNDISKRENHYQRITFRIGLMFWSKKKGK